MVQRLKQFPAARSWTPLAFIPELDGVRGIAVSLVLLFHLKAPLFGIGWCGVDLFFVLSGYLITSILLATKSSPDFFKNFYARRVLRIFPLYFAVLFAVFCVLLPVGERFHLTRSVPLSEQLWYWLYLSNWRNASGHILFYLSHFWTLAVEEQFYLFWPLIVFLLSRRALIRLCAGTIGVCLFSRSLLCWNPAFTELLHRGTVFRMDALAWGALLALASTDPKLASWLKQWGKTGVGAALATLAGILIIVGPTALSRPMLSVGYTALGVGSAGLVWTAAQGTVGLGWIHRILSFRPLQKLGKYSYAIYVLHYPIVIVLFLADERLAAKFSWLQNIGGLLVLRITLGFGLSYVAALLSWNLFEKRILRWKQRFPYTAQGEPRRASEPVSLPESTAGDTLGSAMG